MEPNLTISIIAVVIAAISVIITIYFQWFYTSVKVSFYLLLMSYDRFEDSDVSSNSSIKGIVLTLAFVNSGNVDITVSKSALHFTRDLSTPAIKEFENLKIDPLLISPKSSAIVKLRYSIAPGLSCVSKSNRPQLVNLALSFQTLGPSGDKQDDKINFGSLGVLNGIFNGVSYVHRLIQGIRIR